MAKRLICIQSELRRAINIWKACPPLRVLAVERVSGVSRHRLRPDLYPKDE
jgi:DNA-binding transcriptional regulator YdaS (Cro superfamily)